MHLPDMDSLPRVSLLCLRWGRLQAVEEHRRWSGPSRSFRKPQSVHRLQRLLDGRHPAAPPIIWPRVEQGEAPVTKLRRQKTSVWINVCSRLRFCFKSQEASVEVTRAEPEVSYVSSVNDLLLKMNPIAGQYVGLLLQQPSLMAVNEEVSSCCSIWCYRAGTQTQMLPHCVSGLLG